MVLSSMQLQKVSVTLWFRRLQCLVLRTVLSVFINLRSAECVCLSEMNGFSFLKSKSNPAFHFKIHIQIRKQTVLKSKSCLNPKSYHYYISLHVM